MVHISRNFLNSSLSSIRVVPTGNFIPVGKTRIDDRE